MGTRFRVNPMSTPISLFNLRLPSDLHERFKVACPERGMNRVLISLVQGYVNDYEELAKPLVPAETVEQA